MIHDLELQQKMATEIFKVGKMMALFLKEEKPFTISGKQPTTPYMDDTITLSSVHQTSRAKESYK